MNDLINRDTNVRSVLPQNLNVIIWVGNESCSLHNNRPARLADYPGGDGGICLCVRDNEFRVKG